MTPDRGEGRPGSLSSGSGPLALSLIGITHRFHTTVALDEATLLVRRGTLHTVLGENGAGKTTLMHCAFGMLTPARGRMELDGAPFTPTSPADALQRGVGMVHQHFTLVPAMSVAENVALGGKGRFDRRRAAARVGELAESVGLQVDPDAAVHSLPMGAQQRVEILKALARGARLLILDEPGAVLTPEEAMELRTWLRSYVDAGNTAIVVTHKLREALAMSEDVTVLRRGRTVLTARTSEVDEGMLVRAVIGAHEGSKPGELERAVLDPAAEDGKGEGEGEGDGEPTNESTATRQASRTTGAAGADGPVIQARGLRLLREDGSVAVADGHLEVRAGEIVGIAGVEGAGHRELLHALAGRLVPDGGTLTIPARVGFVPEDRHRDGLVLDFALYENIALADAGREHGRTPWQGLKERTSRLMAEHDVRAEGPHALTRTLSGGNQQKLVLARELDTGAKALVLENPTRGLDVRATSAVHTRLRDARDAGVAIVLYGSDLDEVLALADRMLVMYAGTIREVAHDRDAAARAMVGA